MTTSEMINKMRSYFEMPADNPSDDGNQDSGNSVWTDSPSDAAPSKLTGMQLLLRSGYLGQEAKTPETGKQLSRRVKNQFLTIEWTSADICEDDFAVVLMERLELLRQEYSDRWIFMTPSIQIASGTLSAAFIRACHQAEHRWIATISVLLKAFLDSPKTWVMEDLTYLRAQTKVKSVRFWYWSLHCRGNMFPPRDGIWPDTEWRSIRRVSGKTQSR